MPFTTGSLDALILRQRDSSCRRDWAAFPNGYLGKSWRAAGRYLPSGSSLRLIGEFQNWDYQSTSMEDGGLGIQLLWIIAGQISLILRAD